MKSGPWKAADSSDHRSLLKTVMKNKTGKILFTALIIVAAAAGSLTLLRARHRSETYKKAIAYAGSGRTQSAYELFQTLGRYKNSSELANALLEEDPTLSCLSAKKGDRILFGHYEQDNDLTNGAEPIEWLVLERLDGQLLLLSSEGLDGKPYHTVPFAEITWEECSLRTWLNDEFFNTAFTAKEQFFIPAVANQNKDQSAVGTEGGADTIDRVFLLSEADTSVYLNTEIDQETIGKTYATKYAENRNVEADEEGYISWWLRSPGVYPYSAQFVDQDGKLHLSGAYVDIDYQFAVRPVIWLDLNQQRF